MIPYFILFFFFFFNDDPILIRHRNSALKAARETKTETNIVGEETTTKGQSTNEATGSKSESHSLQPLNDICRANLCWNTGSVLYTLKFISLSLCSLSQKEWRGGGQMIGRRDAETRGRRIRGKPDSPCSGPLSALVSHSRWLELWSRLSPEAQTDGRPWALVIFCRCLYSHEPVWMLGPDFCHLITLHSSVCVCSCSTI